MEVRRKVPLAIKGVEWEVLVAIHAAEQEAGVTVAGVCFGLIEDALGEAGVTSESQNVAAVLREIVNAAQIDAHFHGVRAVDLGDIGGQVVVVGEVETLIAAESAVAVALPEAEVSGARKPAD